MGKYYKPLFIFLIISLVFLIDNVSAATLTSYSSEYDSCSASNKFSYTNIDTNGNWYYYTGTIGSTISNSPNSMQFDFKYDLTAMKYYDVVFTMVGYDIYSSVNSSMVSVLNGSSCGSTTNNNIALVSFNKSNFNSTYNGYKTMTFRIYAGTLISNWSIILENTSPIAGPNTFGVSSISINEVDLSNTDAIIGNQNNNTDAIIGNQNNNTNTITNNQNQNTQDIIDNQNKNNEELKDSINSGLNNCHPSVNLLNFGTRTFSSGGITHTITNNTFNSSGTATSGSSDIGNTSNFFTFNETLSAGTYTFSRTTANGYRLYIRMYDESKSSYEQAQIGANSKSVTFTLNSPKKYFYLFYAGWSSGTNINISNYNLQLQKGNIATKYEPYGEEVCSSKLDDVNSGLNDINGSINNGNIDNDVGTGFFDDFSSQDFGLSDIITIPLNTITSLTSKSCQPLSIPIPKTGRNINLPCMTQVYEDNIGTIFTIWQVVSFGIIAYFIAIDIFHLVKGFKDPDSDKVEVLDL